MTTEKQFLEESENAKPLTADLSRSPIRSQLLWSSFFPMALFGMLITLVVSFSFQKITLNFAEQRNSNLAQLLSARISGQIADGRSVGSIDLQEILAEANIGKMSSIYLLGPQGQVVSNSNSDIKISNYWISQILQNQKATEELVQLPSTQNLVITSTAKIQNSNYSVLLIEPWNEVISTVNGYQFLIFALIFLGIAFSLLMLSWAIQRILQPILLLTGRASEAVPGSVFTPIKETGPKEIRMLIHAFNRMVIRLAKQHTSLRQYAHKALLSQEEERLRLSREIHDGTLQDLVGLHQRIELYRGELETDPDQARNRLNEIDQLINHTIEEMRGISIALRPPILDDLGLPAAIDSMCKQMDQNQENVICAFSCIGNAHRLPADLELAVYRIIQESLTNIRKHVSNVSRANVELIYEKDELIAKISNDGSSFINQDVQGYIKSGHIGLAGMYERARLFGGSLKISSEAGEDTLVLLRLPYEIEI